MFGLGFWEMGLIVMIAMILIPPRQYASYLRKSGKLYKELQMMKTRLMREINLMDIDEDPKK